MKNCRANALNVSLLFDLNGHRASALPIALLGLKQTFQIDGIEAVNDLKRTSA